MTDAEATTLKRGDPVVASKVNHARGDFDTHYGTVFRVDQPGELISVACVWVMLPGDAMVETFSARYVRHPTAQELLELEWPT